MKNFFDKSLLHYINAENKLKYFHISCHIAPLLGPLKVSENFIFSVDFSGYRKKLLTGNGFIIFIQICIYYSVHIIYMVFQIALRVRGKVSPSHWGGRHDENFCYREKFLSIDGNLRSDFDYSIFF